MPLLAAACLPDVSDLSSLRSIKMSCCMKPISIVFFFCSLFAAFAQQTSPPSILWQQSYGGAGVESLYAVQPTPDGGYIFGGGSSSAPGGGKTSPHFGGPDFWVVRVDSQGNKLWEQSFGGIGTDILSVMQPAGDGGFLLGGRSNSPIGGTKTGPNRGGADFWVVRIDSNGEKLWDRTFGGSGDDYLFSMVPTGDGGFLLGGYSESGVSGNKTSQNFGLGDFWLVRIDAAGEKVWEASYGGSGDEGIFSIHQTSDGGFILGGDSDSPPGGNKTSAHHGGKDFWIVRIDPLGNKLWDRSYGGTEHDADYNLVVRQTPDGGYIIAGDSLSDVSGNKTAASFGDSDIWVVRLGPEANTLWQRSFGGNSYEYVSSLKETSDGGFLLGGGSNSRVSGNKSAPLFGNMDYYLFQIDSDGEMVWDASYGGTAEDGFEHVAMLQTLDDGLILAGDSNSGINGIKTSPAIGQRHFWVIKLGGGAPPPVLIAPAQTTSDIQVQGFRFFIEPRQDENQYVSEYSIDLITWVPFQTNLAAGGQIEVVDPGAAGSPRRFYRAYRLP
jgi:hypothetical protein